MAKYLTAVAVGVIIGVAGPQYVFLGPYTLIPWGLVAIALGLWCEKRESLIVGALYGFALVLSFLIADADFNGTGSLLTRLAFFIVFAAFGAVGGVALSVTGYFLKLRFSRPGKIA